MDDRVFIRRVKLDRERLFCSIVCSLTQLDDFCDFYITTRSQMRATDIGSFIYDWTGFYYGISL